MQTIIKEVTGKTKIEKEKEKTYIKKCWNCKSIFTYQKEDIFWSYDELRWTRCPKCCASCDILFKRKFKGK